MCRKKIGDKLADENYETFLPRFVESSLIVQKYGYAKIAASVSAQTLRIDNTLPMINMLLQTSFNIKITDNSERMKTKAFSYQFLVLPVQMSLQMPLSCCNISTSTEAA